MKNKIVQKNNSELNFRKMQDKVLISFFVFVFIITGFLSTVILIKSSQAIRDNASNLIHANSRQLQLNIDSFLDKVESTAALLFSDESYYKYDATNESIDEYSRLQYEDNIMNRIVDLGIMENFSDFGIVYSNNYTVGWISNTTKGLFESGTMYDSFVPYITNEKTKDGWFFGIGGNYDRLYYIKRLNPNAVLIASIYNRELATVFEFPEELKGMIIRLVDDKNQILYSSDKEEIGNGLPADIVSIVADKNTISFSNNDYLVNVNSCDNGWRVVCVIPTDSILLDVKKLTAFTISFSLVLAAIFVLIGMYAFGKFTKPMDTVISSLENKAKYDGLSGLINKISFEDVVEADLKKIPKGRTIVMTIIDVDHFKSVNDTLGHEYGDKVIIRTADLLKRIIPSYTQIGRIGGDEFAIYNNSTFYDKQHMKPNVERILAELSKEFATEFAEERKKLDLSLSIGVAIASYDGEDFTKLYKMADSALYISKENGRNCITFYEEGMNNE